MKKNREPTESLIDDYLPPQALDIEQAVLGAILVEDGSFELIESIIDAESFYSRANAEIFTAMQSLAGKRNPIDLLTVSDVLQKNGRLEDIGGAVYLARISGTVATASNIVYHATILSEKHVQRKLIEAGQNNIKNALNGELTVDDMIASAERYMSEIADKAAGKVNARHVKSIVYQSVEEAYKRVENISKGRPSGINTGLTDLNKITCGWQKSELIIIAARPSMGKTAVMLHFAKEAAKNGANTVIFSIEMSERLLSDRLLLSESHINPDRFRSGYMIDSELVQLEGASASIERLPIFIHDDNSITMMQIRTMARSFKKKGKCDIIFIDYLQIVKESGNKYRNREQQVAIMSAEAKRIAKELDIPVILLSQMNRDVEKRGDTRPNLSDLRESGSIEQDADMVIFIHRPEYYGIKPTDSTNREILNYGELIIRKNRNGPCGIVKFQHNEGLMRVFDY